PATAGWFQHQPLASGDASGRQRLPNQPYGFPGSFASISKLGQELATFFADTGNASNAGSSVQSSARGGSAAGSLVVNEPGPARRGCGATHARDVGEHAGNATGQRNRSSGHPAESRFDHLPARRR